MPSKQNKIDMSFEELLHQAAKSAMEIGEPDSGTRRQPGSRREDRDAKDRTIMDHLDEMEGWQSASDVNDRINEEEDIDVNPRQVRYRLDGLADDGLIRQRKNPDDKRQKEYNV